jgi:hypothetical protein
MQLSLAGPLMLAQHHLLARPPRRAVAITISHVRDGRIVEHWSTLDSLDLLTQLGLRRTLLAATRLLRVLSNRGDVTGRWLARQ